MAFQKTLDLYIDLILPKLADGPKSQLQLGVPRYALEALQRSEVPELQTNAADAVSAEDDIPRPRTSSPDLPRAGTAL